MSPCPGSHEYIERVKAAATARGCLKNVLEARPPHASKPIASWLNGIPQETDDIDEVFALARSDDASSRHAVCIVEDISWDWIGAMGVTWKIEPHFFAQYGVNPQGDNPWAALFPKDSRRGATQDPSKYYHVDGVFEHQHLAGHPKALAMLKNGLQRSLYRRRCWVPTDSSYSPSSSTRFSYCRVNANLCKATHLLL